MRETLAKFPEVLLIDTTHGTNTSRYQVFSFMAHDVFGKGQYVQHTLVQNERSETLPTAVKTFKHHNTAWTKLQCVVVDKDFTEIGVLRQARPSVRILLCQFPATEYLQEEIGSDVYGFTAWQKNRLKAAVELLVYSKP